MQSNIKIKNMMQKDKTIQFDWFNNTIMTHVKMSLDDNFLMT